MVVPSDTMHLASCTNRQRSKVSISSWMLKKANYYSAGLTVALLLLDYMYSTFVMVAKCCRGNKFIAKIEITPKPCLHVQLVSLHERHLPTSVVCGLRVADGGQDVVIQVAATRVVSVETHGSRSDSGALPDEPKAMFLQVVL